MTWGRTTAEKRLPPATPPNRLFVWQPVTDSPSTSTTTADLPDLAGKAVVLRFHLDGNARLYSYRFGDPDPHLRGSD